MVWLKAHNVTNMLIKQRVKYANWAALEQRQAAPDLWRNTQAERRLSLQLVNVLCTSSTT